MVARAWFIGCLAACVLLGCDAPKCEPIMACDIRTGACQRKALEVAACLRGSAANSQVRVKVVDHDTFVDERVRSARNAKPTADEIDLRAGLARFELSVPLDTEQDVRDRYEWVAAFYDGETDSVTVLDRGRSGADDDYDKTILLVHEMTHALQGADGLFDKLYDPLLTYDALLATQGLIEGEATLVEDRAYVEAVGFDFASSHYGRALTSYRRYGLARLVDTENLFVSVRSVVPYSYGATFLYNAYRSGGADAVADMLADPISSTRELTGQAHSKQRVSPPIPEREGATLVGSYHLGTFFFDAFLRRIGSDAPNTLGHVVDDVFSVQRLKDGALLAAWRVRFDDTIDASDVRRFIESTAEISYRVGSQDARDLWLLRGPDDPREGAPPQFVAAPEIDSGFSAPSQSAHAIHCGDRSLRGPAAPAGQ